MNIIAKIVGKEYSWCYIELPKVIQNKILAFGEQIDKEDLFTEEAEGGLEKDCHITLKYALTTEKVKDVRDILKKEKGGKVHLSKSSIFETDDYDVVKMSVESDDLQRLHNKTNNLPHEDKYPEYIPHATIAYVKKGCGKKYDGKFVLNKSFRFNEVFFGNKDKRNYRIILASVKKNLDNTFLRLSIFSKKLFIMSTFKGEWWIIDGQATFADGDVGDMDHDTYVIQYVQHKYLEDERFDHGEWIDWAGNEKFIMEENREEIEASPERTVGAWLLKNRGMSVEALQIARGRGDPKGYGVKILGWKKVNGNEIATWTLDASDMSEIARGLVDAHEDEEENAFDDEETFSIYVESTGTRYLDVPITVIERNTPSDLIGYGMKY